MKQKYTKPEISSVEFKMEQGYAASQGLERMGVFSNTFTWENVNDENYSDGIHDHSFFGEHKTTHYFGGSTDDWD